jgi:hypothetical protein
MSHDILVTLCISRHRRVGNSSRLNDNNARFGNGPSIFFLLTSLLLIQRMSAGPAKEERPPDISHVTPPLSKDSKTPRVLACVLCQQRKVKCDRKYPCANCVKSRVQCVPATRVPSRRKRRFPERELLERLRKYEDLLRQNHITFDPLHGGSTSQKESPNDYDSDDDQSKNEVLDRPSPSTTVHSNKVLDATYVFTKKLPHKILNILGIYGKL